MGNALPEEKIAELDAALTEAANTGQSVRSVAEAQGVSVATAANRRRLLVAEGKLDAISKSHDRPKSTRAAALDINDLLKQSKNKAIATPEDTMRFLSVLLETPGIAPRDRVAVAKHLDELRTKYADKDALGPPPPLTFEDRVLRLSRLLDVCGPKVTYAALENQPWHTPQSCSSSSAAQEHSSESPNSSSTSDDGPQSGSPGGSAPGAIASPAPEPTSNTEP